MNFNFATTNEVCAELGQRIRAQRLLQSMGQRDLAAMAGVSNGTVRNVESTGQASMDSFIRIVQSLGLLGELEQLFKVQVRTIADMEKAEAAPRKRAPRKSPS